MAQLNAAEAATDTGIPPDMIADGEAPDANKPNGEAAPKEPKEDPAAVAIRDLIAKHDKQMNEYQARFDEQGAMIRELLESNKSAETRGYTRFKEEIESKRREAVANADMAAFEAAERELAELQKARSPRRGDT